MTQQDLTTLDKHFAFGENWAAYAKGLSETRIMEAERGLRRLLGGGGLAGKHFLDIGCGSGIHSLAALRLGAAKVTAVDLDPNSVATTRAVLERFASGRNFTVDQISVFDLDHARHGIYNVVYSWGVLHHSGDMKRAIGKATAMVSPGGQFICALYRETWMCPFWKIEKKWYSTTSEARQRFATNIYLFLFRLGLLATGRTFGKYVANYNVRGMDYFHDVHDWLGGYPYESILPGAFDKMMRNANLKHVRSFLVSPKRKLRGLFGTGCDEYVYARD